MPEYKEVETCPVHDEVIVNLARISTKSNILLTLVGIFLVVVTLCVNMTMGANDNNSEMRTDFEVYVAGQNQRLQNIEQAVIRIDERCERIEELLRKE